MRILADENLKPAHVSALDAAGHDVVRVRELLQKGVSDREVLAAARESDRIVVTYDRKDFSNVTDPQACSSRTRRWLRGTCAAPSNS